jgi:hypothetical protein
MSNLTGLSVRKATVIPFFIFSALLINGCKKDSADNNCTTSYSASVSVIIQTNCAYSSGCHGSGSTNTGGPLTSYSLIFSKRNQIKSQVEAGIMPQGGTLPATDKAALISWINCGAANN